ncbi:MAG: hydrogenase nickel incorporation protein HypB, partial [Verrucomicrobiae bacterium]|nr:hydrogenase nickel incorporation protein HypB [Verrucomicrobiae bacterium]
MCTECGCGIPANNRQENPSMPGNVPIEMHGTSSHANFHNSHDHHAHNVGDINNQTPEQRRILDLNRSLLTKNDRIAERNRGFFRAKGLFVINVLSSPGAGKTTFIIKTALLGATRFRTGVIVGDLATDNDAARFRAAGVPATQINTGTVCHLDAEMVEQACAKLDLDNLDLLVIENVGNLVCPAAYDLG